MPTFDGTSPLAWNNFFLQYKLSTDECRISTEENILRLNKYLKGEAKNKVRLLLMSSKDPKKITDILDRQYGGDEKILKELIESANDLETVSSLSQFENFNCSVQNTSAVVENISGDLFDAQKLLTLYLNKLPEHIIMQWAHHLMSKNVSAKRVKFNFFAKWVESVALVVTEVNFFSNLQNIQYSKPIESTSTHLTNKRETTDLKICKLCKTNEHFIEKCSVRVLESDVKKRWEIVRKHHFCFICLKPHR